MDVRTYYKNAARISFIVGIVLMGIVGVYAVSSIWFGLDWLLLIEMGSVSLVLIAISFIQRNRYNNVTVENQAPNLEDELLLTRDHFICKYLPSPNMKISLFQSDGHAIGEIRDAKKQWWKWMIPGSFFAFLPIKYELVDQKQNVVGKYVKKAGLKAKVDILNKSGEKIGMYEEPLVQTMKQKKGRIIDQNGVEILWVEQMGMVQGARIKNEGGAEQARIQCGWMPRDYSNKFKELNLPIVTISDEMSNEERIMAFAIFLTLLSYWRN
ncbi:hypothetical protein WAK64_14630 [Bacillus spongiae]|uniref:DUF58 domain-containing protein n=1 Tax=Bacillus spongiae TaxID=2683610 RepID=A0ABU8HGH4_9BACI